MTVSLAPLLVHNPDVPAAARAALRAALAARPEHRPPLLRAAASVLHREVPLDCGDALALVGLDPKE